MLIHQSENSLGDNFYKVNTFRNKSWYYHFHANYELIYLNKGKMLIRTPGKMEEMKEGDFCLIFSGQPHAIESLDDTEIYICIFSDSYVNEFAKSVKGKIGEKTVFSIEGNKKEYVTNLIFQSPYPDMLSIKSMLYGVCSEYLSETELTDDKDMCIQMEMSILQYIDKNYHKDISLKEISEVLGYEYHYLSRRFNKGFNMNFKNFLNQYRYRKAREMLVSGKYSISDIASMSGFQSVRNFNKVFRELSGFGPREFIKSEKKYNGNKDCARYYQ